MPDSTPKPHSWWQTLPGILTAVAAIITASTGLIVALNQAGAFSSTSTTESSTPTLTAVVSPSPSSPEISAATGVDELEQKLKAANILLSTGEADGREKVRGYFDSPEAAYRLLAVSCIQVMGNQRLKKTGYLDMIDKHYSKLVGEGNYVSSNGKLNLDKVKEAMVAAQKDYNSDRASTFEEIVESVKTAEQK
ncbi:MAG: hypothetical protein ACKVZH_28470 [Blastocatellia bacterium]